MSKLDLKGLNANTRAAEAQRERDAARREVAFRNKVAVQQFMNHNGPLFSAFARAGVSIDAVIEGEVLREPASQAARLAVLVAAKAARCNPSEVSAADARPFRAAAAAYVSSRWLAGMELEIERAATEIAAAVDLADDSWDSDPYRDDGISDNASLMITAVNAATSLARAVEKYDFRGGTKVLGRLVAAVAEASSRTAGMMLGENASDGDVRNVTQTAAKNLASILEACYERKAREVVLHLNGKPEAEKLDWYGRNDPVGEVISSFREWTVCFGAFAVAASREMIPAGVGDTQDSKEFSPAD